MDPLGVPDATVTLLTFTVAWDSVTVGVTMREVVAKGTVIV
jgi:hypothetical protein